MTAPEPLPSEPFDSIGELRAGHEALLDALDLATGDTADSERESAALRGLFESIRAFLQRGAAAGALIEDLRDRTACQVLLDYWVGALGRAGLELPAPRLLRFDSAQLPALPDEPRPYVGLESFREHTYFFGREADTAHLVQQIQDNPLVVVLGASGSGKSSLVLAGALPALRALPQAWRVAPPAVPGDAALQHVALSCLAVCGRPAHAAEACAQQLRADPLALLNALGGDGLPPVVITIDQFEEVFTLTPPVDRDALVQALAAVLQAGAGHRVVLTMREEFRNAIVELGAFERWRDGAWFQVAPMGYEQLRAAVEKPAALVRLQFEAGVVDELVKKVLGQPAALPLLQFTLGELWKQRDHNRITRSVCEAVGDPLTALMSSANRFYDGLLPQTQAEAKRVLLQLVRINELLEAYRQPVRKQRLLQAGGAETEAVLDLLARHDYVRIGRSEGEADDLVEIKHEALIRNWPRLVDWIDDERRLRRQRLALTQAALRWDQNGRPPAGLLTGWQLDEAQRQPHLGRIEQDFVEASAEAIAQAQGARESRLKQQAEAAQAMADREQGLRKQTEALLARQKRLARRVAALSALLAVIAVGLAYALWDVDQNRLSSATLEDELNKVAKVLDLHTPHAPAAGAPAAAAPQDRLPAPGQPPLRTDAAAGASAADTPRPVAVPASLPGHAPAAGNGAALATSSGPAPTAPVASAAVAPPPPPARAADPITGQAPLAVQATQAAQADTGASAAAPPVVAAPLAAAARPLSAEQRVELLVYRLDHDRPAASADKLNPAQVVRREWARIRAAKMNLRTPLGLAVLYDTAVSVGVVRASFIRARNDPANGDEKAWLLDFLDRRQTLSSSDPAVPANEGRRIAELRRLVSAEQWDLRDERPAGP